MSVRSQLLAAGIAGLWIGLACAASTEKNPVAYRWVDENGVIHYGDRIPAQDSQKEREILNRQGVEVGRLEAQKSAAELAEQAKRDEEALRQKQHDSFLLTTYTSAKDIEQLRDVRLDQLNGQRQAAQQYIENLQGRLTALQSRAMLFKPYSSRSDAHKMPDDLTEDLVRAINEMRNQHSTLTTKDHEIATVQTEFDADIQRYKELHVTHR